MWGKLYREPLFHFLMGGFFLFIYFKACGPSSTQEKLIVVNKEQLLDYIQFQSKAFNRELFSKRFDQFSQEEKDIIIKNYVQEEALYREALKYQLEQNDYVIKKRIVQKMEFILESDEEASITIQEDSLQSYFQQNQQRYQAVPTWTFSHIYFDSESDDTLENTVTRAQRFMENPVHRSLSAADCLPYGDRFIYHRHYVSKDISLIESHFGSEFAQNIAQLSPKESWQGPIQSKHGVHWLWISNYTGDQLPELSSIKEKVKADYLTDQREKLKEEKIRELVQQYEVRIDL